jgi:hypothetical protein
LKIHFNIILPIYACLWEFYTSECILLSA